jgi:hypothetical protein
MLTTGEQDEVRTALVTICAGNGNPRLTIVAGLDDRLKGRLDASGDPIALVRQALGLCMADIDHQPKVLIKLLGLAGFDPRIAAIITRLETAPPPPTFGTRFESLVLDTNKPFLDRATVRTSLQALLQNLPTRPFVVVNGAPNQGRSYVYEFICHVLREHPEVAQCFVQVSPATGAAIGPQELARELVTQMGYMAGDQPIKNTNAEAWHEELAIWVISKGLEDRFSWWIILDGFNKDELRADTAEFIDRLAQRCLLGRAAQRFRLILLEFDRINLRVRPGQIQPEQTAPISEVSVKAFIAKLVETKPGLDVDQLTGQITADLGEPVQDLPMLATRLTDLISTLG